jgi:hypothetical protein
MESKIHAEHREIALTKALTQARGTTTRKCTVVEQSDKRGRKFRMEFILLGVEFGGRFGGGFGAGFGGGGGRGACGDL